MDKLEFVKVDNDDLVFEVESLACFIWREYFPSLIGEAQVEYMLDKLQSKKAISQQLKEGYSYYLVRGETGKYAGYFCIQPQADKLFISKIYLKSDVRGKGFGKKILLFIEKLAEQMGYSKVWLTVYKENTSSIKFYEKSGFKLAGSIVTDIGGGFIMDDYKMEKLLK